MSQNVKINIEELYQIFEQTPDEDNIMLLGRHGIGKSEILTRYFENKGMIVHPVFLGQMSDAGDLLGLPDKKDVVNSSGVELKIMDFLPPYWWQEDKPFCLFLDEINRARPEMLQVIMDLALNKKLGGRQLPEGSVIVAAANYGEEYQTTDLDPALVSRFNIYELQPTVQEWINWAIKAQVDSRVISFIQANNSLLYGSFDETADPMAKSPDPRGWEKVSRQLKRIPGKLSPVNLLGLAGVIGQSTTGLFAKHLSSMMTIDARKLLTTKKFADLEMDLMVMTMQDFIYLNKMAMTWIAQNAENIRAKSATQDLICDNFYNYIVYLKGLEHNEVIQELTSQLQANTDTAAILVSDPRIMQELREFILNMDIQV